MRRQNCFGGVDGANSGVVGATAADTGTIGVVKVDRDGKRCCRFCVVVIDDVRLSYARANAMARCKSAGA